MRPSIFWLPGIAIDIAECGDTITAVLGFRLVSDGQYCRRERGGEGGEVGEKWENFFDRVEAARRDCTFHTCCCLSFGFPTVLTRFQRLPSDDTDKWQPPPVAYGSVGSVEKCASPVEALANTLQSINGTLVLEYLAKILTASTTPRLMVQFALHFHLIA